MTIKTYLWGMGLCTLLCAGAWISVLGNVDPTDTDMVGFGVFYLTIFFALASFFSLMGFLLRRRIFEDKIEFRQVEIAFRQGVLLALIFVGLLFLQGQGMLNLYSAFTFVLVAVVVEFYFTVKK